MGMKLKDIIPISFNTEPIDVNFVESPLLEKKPGCPQKFTWRGTTFDIVEILSEWHEYKRRGRMARNMTPGHAAFAERRGSWGVGQDYYRVRTSDGRIFDIYYDRAPKDVNHRKGGWFLYRELAEKR